MKFTEAFLAEFDQEMAATRRTLERIPDGKADWKPHDKSMALGRLANHVAEIPGWVAVILQQESLDLPETYQPQLLASREEILAAFDKSVGEARQAIQAADPAGLDQAWTLRFGGKLVFSMPRQAVLRGMVMNHLIHHRAQLGVYLRLNDIPVPAIYGPSADEPGEM
jgi:uncharacterized damage-inducible protein DinB